MNILDTIAPKSDQLNSDDLISGPLTVTITAVSANEGAPEQPVNVFFDGDNGKPYRPCKSMRRVMVAIWGADASAYVGRSMTLYRDPAVKFGGMEVGGTRISHMSHIDKPQTMALTATRANRKPFTVRPLVIEKKPPPVDADAARAEAFEAASGGKLSFQDWWKANPSKRAACDSVMAEIKAACAEADAEPAKTPTEPPFDIEAIQREIEEETQRKAEAAQLDSDE